MNPGHKHFLVLVLCTFTMAAHAVERDSSGNSELSKSRKALNKILDPSSVRLKKTFHFLDNMNTRDKGMVKRETALEEYEPFRDKTIRQIHIDVMDPYGKGINEEDEPSLKPIKEFANKIHTTTRPWVVKKDLQFHEGERVNPAVFVDCVRSLRENDLYKDAVIQIIPVEGTEFVDVYVITQDRFSWDLSSAVTVQGISGKVGINNFLGLSQQFFNRITFKYYDPKNPISGRGKYKIYNIARTPINLEGNYFIDKKEQRYGFEAGKDFFKSGSEWAASLKSYWVRERYDYFGEKTQLRYNYQDVWLAKAFKLDKLIKRSEQLRFVISGRMYSRKYTRTPFTEIDLDHQDQRFVLAGAGIANRDFYIEKNIYYFGEDEYLPKGLNVTALAGYSFNQYSTDRWYSGIMFNYSKSFGNLGYLFTQASFGGFTNFRKYEEMEINVNAKYLTKKFNLGNKWAFRQFLFYDMNLGYMRLYEKDLQVVDGLHTDKFKGSRKWTLDFQSVIYPPFKVLWFESNVFLFGSLGMVGQKDELGSLVKSRLYQGYGAGIRLRNRKLGLDYLEISFGIYPNKDVNDANFYNFWTRDFNNRGIKPNNLFQNSVLSPGFEDEEFGGNSFY